MVGFSSPRGGVCQRTKDMETDDEDVEEPSFGRPHHGENRDAVSKLKKAQGGISFEVCNDLPVAIEVNPGTGWKVLYPADGYGFRLDTLRPVDVAARLRDDPDICGTCCVGATALLRATEAFGHSAAVEFIEAEQREVEHERQLHEARLQKLKVALLGEDDLFRKWFGVDELTFYAAVILLLVLCWLLFLFAWAIVDDDAGEDLTPFDSLVVVAVICIVCILTCFTWWLLGKAKSRAAAEVKLLGEEIAHSCSHRCYVRFSYTVLVLFAASFVYLTVECCVVDPWFALIFGPAWLCWSCLVLYCYLKTHDNSTYQKEKVNQVSQNTIVFNGRVLDSHPWLGLPPCVCSWPGKYASAWDILVESTRDRGLSAAVVFLPEGSEHFGSHDPIPPAEALEGECWCIPLYGEKKPWGCRWWTLWIANIEKAVEYGAEINVFFFEKKKGQGKVQSFATAGQENLRREAISQRKAEFEESVEFQNAKAAGLGKLSKCKRLDSSSQYTREWQRLFLAWLPEEDRQFLEASEGLGNSQKAEVAWLERKGYAYKEVELNAATWTRFQPSTPSPKVIGAAAEP